MISAPKSLRLQIGLFGRTNVGKSSFLNFVSGQNVAITSSIPGTTTDVVEKVMELLPVGPVVFLDTAGLDDSSALSAFRLDKTNKIFNRADIVVLIVEPGIWTEYEEAVLQTSVSRKLPCLAVINKIDLGIPAGDFRNTLSNKVRHVLMCSSLDLSRRDVFLGEFKRALRDVAPDAQGNFLIGDLLPPGGMAVLIVPIDLQAPKGRLILPQVQAVRDALDNDAAVLVVKEREYSSALANLRRLPDIVVCDSQVVMKMVADTPENVPCTTFSILFARNKGDLAEFVRGVRVIDSLIESDRVLVAESCSHHAIEDDIGRVKIPRWLKQYTGKNLIIDTFSGRDYPRDLSAYKLIVHCGSCMLTRTETLWRIKTAKEAGVAITNYGVCISYLQGVLGRVLSPFPSALELLKRKNKPADKRPFKIT